MGGIDAGLGHGHDPIVRLLAKGPGEPWMAACAGNESIGNAGRWDPVKGFGGGEDRPATPGEKPEWEPANGPPGSPRRSIRGAEHDELMHTDLRDLDESVAQHESAERVSEQGHGLLAESETPQPIDQTVPDPLLRFGKGEVREECRQMPGAT